MKINILLVDDESGSRRSMAKFLRRLGHEITECQNGDEALASYLTGDYQLVLSDLKMPGMSGVDLIKAITSSAKSWMTDCVLFTGYGDMETAIAAMRANAYDYLLKPVNADELVYLIKRVAEHQVLRKENWRLTENFNSEVEVATKESRNEINRLRKIVMQTTTGLTCGFFSSEMKSIEEIAYKYHEDRSIPVLIEGETGTGKEVIARLIHYGQLNKQTIDPFIDINCAALTASLFESELFGYEAGAFTGGLAKGQKGKFDIAGGGSLFLDEMGEIPLELQGKLLRVIQEKEFYRVGGVNKIAADARLICATNADLKKMVEQKTFRRDLFYRLRVGHIRIPPLRQRQTDILPLAMMFLERFAREKKKNFQTISPAAADMLMAHSWPGNVRELRNMIEWVVFMYNDTQVRSEHLRFSPDPPPETLDPLSAAALSQDGGLLQINLPARGYSLSELKDYIIGKILEREGGNMSATARYLSISRKAMNLYLHRLANKRKPNI